MNNKLWLFHVRYPDTPNANVIYSTHLNMFCGCVTDNHIHKLVTTAFLLFFHINVQKSGKVLFQFLDSCTQLVIR